jgi:hypothetical protein
MVLCGAIFKSTEPDESDAERRELERYAHLIFCLSEIDGDPDHDHVGWLPKPLSQRRRPNHIPRLLLRTEQSRSLAQLRQLPRRSIDVDMDTDMGMDVHGLRMDGRCIAVSINFALVVMFGANACFGSARIILLYHCANLMTFMVYDFKYFVGFEVPIHTILEVAWRMNLIKKFQPFDPTTRSGMICA